MPISFNKLGQMGRLGNSLFQIASVCGIAKRLNTPAHFQNWKYQKYFVNKLPKSYGQRKELYEPFYHYTDDWFEDGKDYVGWLQSDKYFESREAVKEIFRFENTFIELVKAKYQNQLSKETICISIRRGDFVGNPNYEPIPETYYIGALLKFDYKNYNILFFSDDISYCKLHFQCLDNAFFIEADPIEQLCLMGMCDNHIVSSSSFSWWGAYISNSKRVIRPAYNFSKSYLTQYDDKDYYPEDWEIFDHKGYKIPLGVTFVIPVQYDHVDRLDNFKICLKELEKYECKIIVGENRGGKFYSEDYKYMMFKFTEFHRTKMINEMVKEVETAIFVNHDADVIAPPMQFVLAVERIVEGIDVVYPYDGRFARVPKKWHKQISIYEIGITSKETFEGSRKHDLLSVGGSVMFNRESFLNGGGENESMISYAPEDKERYYRFMKLGFSIARVKGILFHLDHFIGLNSYIHHPNYEANEDEWNKIKEMNAEQLREYVNLHHTL